MSTTKIVVYRLHQYKISPAICHCLRYYSASPSPSSTSMAFPIPGKRTQKNINHAATKEHSLMEYSNHSTAKNEKYLPWQQRSITLYNQPYKLPQLILKRIESVSNTKIDIACTTPNDADAQLQAEHREQPETEIYGENTSLISSFQPRQYYNVTITGDGHAVDTAIQIYIYYSQNAIPIVTECHIPADIVEVICNDFGCFIEEQNDYVYRIYPTTLDNKTERQTMHEIQKKIRKSIHKLTVNEPWFENESLMKMLFRHLKKQAIAQSLSFKTGGYFWYNQHSEDDDEQHGGDDDAVDSNKQYIWTYQYDGNKEIMDIQERLQSMIDAFTRQWHLTALTSKTRPILSASQHKLWNYIKDTAKSNWNVECVLSNEFLLYQPQSAEFEQFVQQTLEHVVYTEINVVLSDHDRQNLDALCRDYQLLYIIPPNEAFISYYKGKFAVGKVKQIETAIRNIVDPFYEPQQNIVTKRAKTDQVIKITNSEKFHVLIRMMQYLEQLGEIKHIKQLKQDIQDQENSNKVELYYSILTTQRSIALTFEGHQEDEEDADNIQRRIDEIYDYVNNVQSVSVPLPILFLLRSNTGYIASKLETDFNMILSSPPLRSIAHILKQHKEQKRVLLRNQKRSSTNSDVKGIDMDEVLVKMYFWSKESENLQAVQHFFDTLVYKHIDLPVPIDLLFQSGNQNVSRIQAATHYVNKYNLLCIANHPQKALSQSNPDFKFFNPKMGSKYWLFADLQHKANIDACMDEMRASLDECPFIDLGEMAPLVGYLQIASRLREKLSGGNSQTLQTFVNVESGKLFCFGRNSQTVDSFRSELDREMKNIQNNHCLSIAGNKYGDIVLFMVPHNFKRIQNVVRNKAQPKTGFVWFGDAEQRFDGDEAAKKIHIYCRQPNVLHTVEKDVIQSIADHSKILYWNRDFTVSYDEFRGNKSLQRELETVMKQTGTHYALREQRAITPSLCLTNYDQYELDAAHSKLLKLLRPHDEQSAVEEANINNVDTLTKPIILS